MTEDSDILILTDLQKEKIQQLQIQVQMAKLAYEQYVQGCVDGKLPPGDKSTWTLGDDRNVHRVKEAPKGEEPK